MLTNNQYEEICDAHENESLWYFFLNYGDPLGDQDLEYAKKYKMVAEALDEYCNYMNKQQELLNSDRELSL